MEKILGILRTNTFYNTSIVSVATALNGGLGFIYYFLLARFFDPATLGIFIVAITTATLITDIGSVGTETGVVNFVSRNIKTDKNKALRFLKLAFEAKLVVAIIIVTIGWILMPGISTIIFNKAYLVGPLRISLIIAAGLLFFAFGTSSLTALQKFYHWGLINISSNALRLIFTVIFFWLGILSINNSFLIYFTIPFGAFLVSLIFIPNFFKVKGEEHEFKEFFHYNKWVAVFTLIAAVSSRLDVFLVTKLLNLSDVGIYSVAVTLTSIIPQFVGVVGTVVAPKLAGMESKTEAIKYLKKLQLFVAGLSLFGLIAGSVVGYIVITSFYSQEYLSSFGPYLILLVSQIIFLLSIPVHMALTYYFSYPKLFVYVAIVNIICVLGLGYLLINSWGFVGAALAVLFGNIINFIIPLVWVIRRFK